MDIDAALAAANAAINAVGEAAIRNGEIIQNSTMPATSHVRARALWVLQAQDVDGPTSPDVLQAILWHSRMDLDANALTAQQDKLSIDLATILVLSRAAFWRYFGLTDDKIAPGEKHIIPVNAVDLVPHQDHIADIIAAIARWAPLATRFMGVAWYNALSFETCNHHHLPDKTGRLASTTITLLGMRDYFDSHATDQAEGVMMHDMFHPLGSDVKAGLARNRTWAATLTDLQLDNLRKRIPVKAADTAYAVNYPVLLAKARSYVHNPDMLPASLDVPTQLTDTIAAYEQSQDAAAARVAASNLRAMAGPLAEPSAYIVGWMLGRERATADDPDLTLRTVGKRITIMGSPAYARAAAEFPGTFSLGTSRGGEVTTRWFRDNTTPHVMARIEANLVNCVQAYDQNRAVIRQAQDRAARAALARPVAPPPNNNQGANPDDDSDA